MEEAAGASGEGSGPGTAATEVTPGGSHGAWRVPGEFGTALPAEEMDKGIK